MDSSKRADRAAGDPPTFDPTEPALPVSYPITTLEDLESRTYFKSFHYPFNKASVSLPTGNVSLANRPRNLVCHDMAGGYLDDKWVQGGGNAEAYAIWHWYLIDVFVYFSHNLVTLPPPCWTNTAHKHGIRVLGTFILEGNGGTSIADKIFSTKESADMYAERLAELATSLGFDGWLMNMEVNLDAGQIPNLKEFVSHLTKTMHTSLPGSLVIWYDSVTIDGSLSYQNQLNEKNKPFFDICDGIFVNYWWKEDYPKLSATVAGDRKFDVYMGVDVFGRSTYGGGKWNTNVALDVMKKADVSAAMYAPGWVYETKQPPDFQTAQNRWWSLVEKSWGMSQNYPQVLPFYSNFDQGRGYRVAEDGLEVSSAPWNNLSSQSFQPFLEFSEETASIKVLVNLKEDSYSGGGNITFKGTLANNATFTARLFQGDLPLGESPVYFIYSVKSDASSLIGLSLKFSSSMDEKTSILLASWRSNSLTTNQLSSRFGRVINPLRVTKLETDPEWVIQESSITMNKNILKEIHVLCYRPNPEPDEKLELPEYFAVIGHLTIKTPDQNLVFPPSTSWEVEGKYVKWTSGSQGSKDLSLKLIWSLKDGDSSIFPKYNIFVEKLAGAQKYIGVAQIEAFYVSDLSVPSGTSSLKFIIQVCGMDGTSQKANDSPSFELPVEG
ncbi:Mannosyl-glycoprotein endo-beta-N-acetylglucosaminidase [Bertholletia excelsa]